MKWNYCCTGILSRLIFDILKLNQACLLIIFLRRLFPWQNYTEDEIHDLYVNKKSINEKITYDNLNEFYIIQTQKYNRNSDETKIDNVCLSYVFEPLVDSKIIFFIFLVIMDNPNEIYVNIEEEKIDTVISKLDSVFDSLFLIDVF